MHDAVNAGDAVNVGDTVNVVDTDRIVVAVTDGVGVGDLMATTLVPSHTCIADCYWKAHHSIYLRTADSQSYQPQSCSNLLCVPLTSRYHCSTSITSSN